MEEYSINLENAPSEYISEFIKLELFKKVRLNAMSDKNGILLLEYSSNKDSVDISNEIKLPSGKWISVSIEPKMKYFRYHLKMIEEGHGVQVNLLGTPIPPSTGWFW